VAASLVLLIAAGLFVRSLQKAGAVAPGFDTDHAAIISFNLGLHRYQEDRGRQFYERLVERAGALPGAQEVSLTDRLPLSNLGPQSAQVFVVGRDQESDAQGTTVQYARISPRYFRTLGIPLRQGRDFTPQDDGSSPLVAIINQTAARTFWPNHSPLGQRLRRDGKLLEVVGVVEDTKVTALNEEAQPYLYLPFAQNYAHLMQVVVRATDHLATMLSPLRNLAREIDDNVAIFQLKTMPEHVGVELYPLRLTSSLLTLFGLLALMLASIGLYGVMTFSVSQRTRELGIRLALGAQPRDILRLVIGRGLALSLIGVTIGLLAALAITRFISSLLFAVGATDALTFAIAPLVLAGVSLLACWVPARRATRVDPMVALRYE
jgi:predicted permease